MKKYLVIKKGYSYGVYGCTGEYFVVIAMDTEKDIINTWLLKGLYGVENRVGKLLTSKGYKRIWINAGGYGQIKGEEKKGFEREDIIFAEIEKLED